MDRPKIHQLRESLKAVLEPFAKEHGLALNFGNASFSPSNVTFKVEFAEIKNGVVESREAMAFREMASLYGLKPDDLGKSYVKDGKTFTVKGAMPRSSRYPILCESDGKSYKVPAETVARFLHPK